MKAKITLAEYAAQHPDGTITIVRSGISNIGAPGVPIQFQSFLVIRMEADMADEGVHQFDIRCMNQDGKDVMPPLKGQAKTPAGGGLTNLILATVTTLPAFGDYVFIVRIDNVECDRWGLKARELPKKENGDA